MTKEDIEAKASKLTQDEYFARSEDREVVTPENIGGLVEYPALFNAMHSDRELRPALSEAMSTGRAMSDFLSMQPEEFLGKYVVADGPVNPKTGKPYGADTKAFLEWRAMQAKTPVSVAQFNMFGKMAQAYNSHEFVRSFAGYERMRNVVLGAIVERVPCMCKVDSLYVSQDGVFAVDVKTTGDLFTFARLARGIHYHEQQALISLILDAVVPGTPHGVAIVALEKGPIPRAGVFTMGSLHDDKAKVHGILAAYAESKESGKYATGFEAPVVI